MENSDSSINYTPMNILNKNLSPTKDFSNFQSNAFIIKENYQNTQNNLFYNNLSNLATPKKEAHILDPEIILSPFISNSKIDISNNNYLLTTIRKNSLNDTPFKPMINNSPFINTRILEKT